MAQLLAKEFSSELGPRGQQLIGQISGGLERMKGLLNDLLDFARASHFDETTAAPVRLDAPLEYALENLKSEVEQSRASVNREPLPVVAMHETHALQLFQNLIGNAIRYRAQHPPLISVTSEKRGSEWIISVKDNGIGIESKNTEQIFEPFKRLHGGEYPGSGIGLATCQKIVKGYGGRIWVESAPGSGSTFRFSVPALEKEASFGFSSND
jgi:signal transduction histidine kinase